MDTLTAQVQNNSEKESQLTSLQEAVTHQSSQLLEMKASIRQLVSDKTEVTKITLSLESIEKQRIAIN